MITPGRNLYILHLYAISKTAYVTMTALILLDFYLDINNEGNLWYNIDGQLDLDKI
jgi:hypothetical protein